MNFLERFLASLKELPKALAGSARQGYVGEYATWNQAYLDSNGYDSKLILERVRESLLKVKSGDAVHERDSVLFERVQYSWPLLACLLWAASRNDNRLHLVDFGGSLGSSYFQNRHFFNHLIEIRWCVIEQPHFVQCGKKDFETAELRFYSSLEECLTENAPSLLLMSSVLQYVERPYELLSGLLPDNFKTVVVDRTPFLRHGHDRITVQKVPPEIYPASYPAWLFNQERFLEFFRDQYNLIADFPSAVDEPHDDVIYKGFIFERIVG